MELRQLKMNMCNMVWNNGFSRLSYQANTKARAKQWYNWKNIWEWGERITLWVSWTVTSRLRSNVKRFSVNPSRYSLLLRTLIQAHYSLLLIFICAMFYTKYMTSYVSFSRQWSRSKFNFAAYCCCCLGRRECESSKSNFTFNVPTRARQIRQIPRVMKFWLRFQASVQQGMKLLPRNMQILLLYMEEQRGIKM